jgi:hypothetical protein
MIKGIISLRGDVVFQSSSSVSVVMESRLPGVGEGIVRA